MIQKNVEKEMGQGLMLRKKKWEALFSKYEKRGRQNDAACYFHEVNYKLFAKPPSKVKHKSKKRKNKKRKSKSIIPIMDTFKNIDVSDIIDLDKNDIFAENFSYSGDQSGQESEGYLNNDESEESSEAIDSELNASHDDVTSTISTTDIFKNIDVSEIIDLDNNDTFTENLNFPCNNQNRQEGKVNLKSDESRTVSETTDSGFDVSRDDVTETDTVFVSLPLYKNDISEIVEHDKDIHTKICRSNNQSQCSKVDFVNNLHKLIRFVEQDLKSNLKVAFINRSVAKLLESKDYDFWHKCTKKEMKRLTRHISRNDLKEYMRHCHKGNVPENLDVNLLHEIIAHKMNSNLKELFIKREFARDDKNRYFKYTERLLVEWKRLLQLMPVDYLLLYGSSVLHSINRIREKTSYSREAHNQ